MEAPARPEARRLRPQRRHGAGQAGRQAAARAGRRHRRGAPRRRRRRRAGLASRWPAPASSTSGSAPTSGCARWSGRWPQGPAYGRTAVGQGKKVIVEYVSANPTGPMHVGHGRNAVTGDGVAEPAALGRLRRHPRVLRQRLRRAGADPGPLGPPPLPGGATAAPWSFPPKAYPGEYVKEIAAALAGRVRRPVPRRPRGRVAGALPRPGRGSTSSG